MWIYVASNRETCKALRHGSHTFSCKQHHTCLYLVSIHQMALPLIVVHRHLIAAYTHTHTDDLLANHIKT